MLAIGALVGLAMAAAGLLGGSGPGPATLPAGAAAVVNGRVVPAAAFERALGSLQEVSRDRVGPARRRALLERLVDEELLVQHGLALGLVELDRKLRGDLVRAVIDHAIAAAAVAEPSPQQLEEFYAANADAFLRSDALLVRQLFLRVDDWDDAAEVERLHRRAAEARGRLVGGEDFDAVAAELGDPPSVAVPRAYLNPAKLSDYLGATALRSVVSLESGGVSFPLRSPEGYHIYQLVGRREAALSPLDSVRELVASEYRRRRDDDTLRALIADLRDSAAIALMDNP